MINIVNQNSKNLLIIFARDTVMGKVKTRLSQDIGEQAALDIYNYLLQQTFEITRELPVEKIVSYADGIPEKDIWDNAVYKKSLQQGNDLGERMQNAFEEGFSQGFNNISLIGSDLFDLTREDLERAFKELEHYPYVIGPATDGGYYLIGMKQEDEQIFKNKAWGTSRVFQDTVKDLCDKEVFYLEYRNDVDVVSDIKHIPHFQQYLQYKQI